MSWLVDFVVARARDWSFGLDSLRPVADATPVMLFRFASDELLVARVRAGSTPAFEALFDRHHRPLLAFCRHMLGSAADAEDAVQHTFMAAYSDLVRSSKPIALRPWLYSIARHRCLSVLRARRERPVAELPEAEAGHLVSEIDAREELRATLADIAHLPEDQRAALVLAELGDVPHAEIAQILGCRHEKVKALVFQARSTLATCRVARDTPCADIREQLAAGGVALRRTPLRRHVRDCPGCREFDELLRVQRRRLRVLLPIAPSLGLKRAVLGAVWSSGGGGAVTGVTAAIGALGVGGVAATAIVSVAIAGGGPRPPAAPAGNDLARAAIGAAKVDDAPRQAARVAGSRAARPRTVTQPRLPAPVAVAPRRTAPEPARTPSSAGREPATSAVPTAATPSSPAPVEEAPAQPAVSRRPPDPPGQAKAPTPPRPSDKAHPEPPGGGKSPESPGGGKPAELPGKGGGNPPAEAPAGGPEQHPQPGGPAGLPPGADALGRAPSR
jgi:RNA polymerase sigma factor (sigma-70 family)